MTKHGRTLEHDAEFNKDGQLVDAAINLILGATSWEAPQNWDNQALWDKMREKPLKERLVIAGALIAAEIDRLDGRTSAGLLNNLKQALEPGYAGTLNYTDAAYGQMFWDEEGEPIGVLHGSDGELREEYMAKLFTHFGVAVKYEEKAPSNVVEMLGDQVMSEEETEDGEDYYVPAVGGDVFEDEQKK